MTIRLSFRPFLWAIASVGALWIGGAAQAQFPNLPSAPDRGTSKDRGKSATPKAPSKPGDRRLDPNMPDLWEPGDEVVPPKPLPPGREPPPRSSDGGEERTSSGENGPRWAVLVASYTQSDHRQVAMAMRDRMAERFPRLRESYVERTSGGSVILLGRFSGPDDPRAQSALRDVKAIEAEGQRPFAGAMLTRTATSSEPPGPYDVRRLRERFPNVVPLYSLQVAAWSTFGDRQVTPAAVRAAADAYVKELRVKGFEAWVHHDENTSTSVVTVGQFDTTAYDPRSTLYAPEVESLMRRFPRHLINGEELLIPVDPRRPDGPKKPQGCRLVEIPR